MDYMQILLIGWKTKKGTIHPINDYDKCFQYAANVILNHEKIGKNLQRILKIKPFITKYYWKVTNYLSQKDDWKKFEKNNSKTILNV